MKRAIKKIYNADHLLISVKFNYSPSLNSDQILIQYRFQFFFYGSCSPIAGYGLLILGVFRDHTQRHTTVGRTPLYE